jgi:hypothetical protein
MFSDTYFSDSGLLANSAILAGILDIFAFAKGGRNALE